MFYYLSFLRPPPTHAPASGSLSITPQIANDLRTELFEGDQDIFYVWRNESFEFNSNIMAGPVVKLTTWHGSASAYKELKVPLPSKARDGDEWRLVLICNPQQPAMIDLADPTVGSEPFPVISMPVKISSGAKDKQDRIQRAYKLPLMPDEFEDDATASGDQVHIPILITEHTSFDLDKKIWDSGVGLSSWLVRFFCEAKPAVEDAEILERLREALFSSDQRTILELGAGTGVLSIILCAIRSRLLPVDAEDGDRVLVTDLESAIPILSHNIFSNSAIFRQACTPEPNVLNWDEDLPESIEHADFDVVLMADVTYNTSSFPSLVRTIASLAKKDKHPIILLGYKERHPSERELWTMAAGEGIEFIKVDQLNGASDPPVEIWIGRAQ